jgi:Family of unknown function (DUF5906)
MISVCTPPAASQMPKRVSGENRKYSGDSEKGEEPGYAKIYDDVIEHIAELGITMERGILQQPNQIKTDIPDVVSAIVHLRAKRKLSQYAKTTIADIIAIELREKSGQEVSDFRAAVGFVEGTHDRWPELMEVAFGRYDEIDCQVLKHQIWLIKRRSSNLEVDRELLVNLYGPKGVGKSRFLEEYLLSPVPRVKLDVVGDMSSYINDDRFRDAFTNKLVLIFGERSKGEKVNIEQMKQIIDSKTLTRRNLGLNSFSTNVNRATLFATSNTRLRENTREEHPRKWYEIDFGPWQTDQQLTEYLRRRGEIPVLDLWRCINENEDSSVVKNWERVQERIDATCRFVPPVVRWILDYVVRGGYHLTLEDIPFSSIWEEYKAFNDRNEFRVSERTFSQRMREVGFESKKKADGMYVRVGREAFARIQEQHRAVADDNEKEVPDGGVLDT